MREKYLSLLVPRGNSFFPSHFVFTLTSHLFQCRWGQGRSEHKGLRMVKRQHYHSRKGPPHKIQPQSPVSSWAHVRQSGDFLHTAFKNGLTKQPECCLVSQTYQKKCISPYFWKGVINTVHRHPMLTSTSSRVILLQRKKPRLPAAGILDTLATLKHPGQAAGR